MWGERERERERERGRERQTETETEQMRTLILSLSFSIVIRAHASTLILSSQFCGGCKTSSRSSPQNRTIIFGCPHIVTSTIQLIILICFPSGFQSPKTFPFTFLPANLPPMQIQFFNPGISCFPDVDLPIRFSLIATSPSPSAWIDYPFLSSIPRSTRKSSEGTTHNQPENLTILLIFIDPSTPENFIDLHTPETFIDPGTPETSFLCNWAVWFLLLSSSSWSLIH